LRLQELPLKLTGPAARAQGGTPVKTFASQTAVASKVKLIGNSLLIKFTYFFASSQSRDPLKRLEPKVQNMNFIMKGNFRGEE
jgi:hypothetical protein